MFNIVWTTTKTHGRQSNREDCRAKKTPIMEMTKSADLARGFHLNPNYSEPLMKIVINALVPTTGGMTMICPGFRVRKSLDHRHMNPGGLRYQSVVRPISAIDTTATAPTNPGSRRVIGLARQATVLEGLSVRLVVPVREDPVQPVAMAAALRLVAEDHGRVENPL